MEFHGRRLNSGSNHGRNQAERHRKDQYKVFHFLCNHIYHKYWNTQAASQQSTNEHPLTQKMRTVEIGARWRTVQLWRQKTPGIWRLKIVQPNPVAVAAACAAPIGSRPSTKRR